MQKAVHRGHLSTSLKGDFLKGFENFFRILNLITITIGAAFLSLLDYEEIKQIILYLVVTYGLYLVIEYLTLLPHWLAIFLPFFYPVLSKKLLFPFVFVSVVLSFFIIFAI